MKKVSVLVVVTLTALVSAPAMALNIDTHPVASILGDNELNLYQIVNAIYGTSFISSAQMMLVPGALLEPNDQTFDSSTLPGAVQAEARYAANAETFGWYEPVGMTNPTLHTLMTVTTFGIGNLGTAMFNPSGDFGLYLNSAGGSENRTWYSEDALNNDPDPAPTGAADHMLLFNLAALTGNSGLTGHYLAAWEDRPVPYPNAGADPGHDTDYNDLVLEFGAVPEPSSMVLLGIGAVGLLYRRFRSMAVA